jgi:VanZ family protein
MRAVTTVNRRRWRQWLYLWLPVAAWMGLIFGLSAQSSLPHVDSGWVDLVLSSAAHVSLFGVLAVLWARALDRRPHAWLLALVMTALYALSDEFHQAFVPGRTPDPVDLLCDGLGAVVGLWLWAQLQRRLRTWVGKPGRFPG